MSVSAVLPPTSAPVPVPVEPARRVFIVSVCTNPSPCLGYLLASAWAHGNQTVTVLGMGDPTLRRAFPRKYWIKPWLYRAWLRNALDTHAINPHDLVLFVDALDVVIRGSAEQLLAGWRAAGSPPVLLSAERNCFPDGSLAAKYPATASPYKYVNSGTIAGTAAGLRNVLDTVPIFDAKEDDQRMWTHAFLTARDSHGIALDTQRALFACLHVDSIEQHFHPSTRAVVFHFNGQDSKMKLDTVFRSWFPTLQQPGNQNTGMITGFSVALAVLVAVVIALAVLLAMANKRKKTTQ